MTYQQSIVLCWEGPRGSGKTLSMVYDAVIRMLRGVHVWANINIEFATDIMTPGRMTVYRSTPIDMDAIYSFDSGVANGFVYIDELPLWANSRKSMSVANSLINSMFSIIRHRGLSFGMTSQQFEWLDKRLKYQVDTLASCIDLHHRYHHLPHGTLIGLSIKDLSGLTTGYPYHITNKVVQRQLYAKPFWNCYDSWAEFDVLEASRSVNRGRVNKVLKTDDTGKSYVSDKGFDSFMVGTVASNVVNDMVNKGQSEILAADIMEVMKANGIDTSLNKISPILQSNGLKYHRGRVGKYILGSIDNN